MFNYEKSTYINRVKLDLKENCYTTLSHNFDILTHLAIYNYMHRNQPVYVLIFFNLSFYNG